MADTLYITDLDGTLLNAWKRIPADSLSIINNLIDDGAQITVATARSIAGIDLVKLDQIHFKLPLVLMNGVMIYDSNDSRIVDHVAWQEDTVKQVIEICQNANKNPFIYYINEGNLTIEYQKISSSREQRFFEERSNLYPDLYKKVEQYSHENAVFMSIQDSESEVIALANQLTKISGLDIAVYGDNYNFGNFFLEVYSQDGGKDSGVRKLKQIYSPSRVVVFGDNYNDIPMFNEADIAVAVDGSPPEVKAAADIVIGPNHSNSVAKFIQSDFYKNS